MRLLHISDTHAQFEAMKRVNRLAHARTDCDVVAHTGDCVSNHCNTLPSEWDRWPQALKLSVPGNHKEHSRSFDHLKTWIHRVPWVQLRRELLFVGLDLLSNGGAAGLDRLKGAIGRDTKAIVVLTHERPRPGQRPDLLASLTRSARGRPFLILHGHEHPKEFNGSEWNCSDMGGTRFYRSNVCSSAKRRGLGHLIEWRGGSFACAEVRGDQ